MANPAERLRFQDGNPNQIKSVGMIIDRVETKDGSVVFSKDLTSIIGMRGNGKSILLKAIASKVSADEFASRMGDRAKSDIAWRDKAFGDFKVVWADESENSGTVERPKHVFYLPQGFLSNIAYEENAKEDERRDFLLGLLRKDESFCNAEKQVRNFINKNDQSIHQTINALFEENDAIEKASNENRALGDIKQLQSDSEDFDKKIKALSSKNAIKENEQDQYSTSKAAIPMLSSKIAVIRQDIKILDVLKDNKMSLLSNMELAAAGLSNDTKQRIENETKKKGDKILNEVISAEQQTLRKLLEESEAELMSHNETVAKLTPKFEERKEIIDLIAHKSELDSNIKRIQLNEDIIKKNKELIEQDIGKLCEMYFLYKEKQAEIFKTVKFDNLEFLSIDLDINETLKNDFIETYINSKSLSRARESSKDFINNGRMANAKILRDVVKDIIDGGIMLKKGYASDKKHAINELLRNPFEIDFLRSIKTTDRKTNFLDMTGGQKAIAMLELIFTFDNNQYPILLDQPEDDIDTSGVSGSVVDFIKKQKEKRQIIIVSHSGSLVVCSDSEEIIIAKNNKGKFTYQTGAIEDEDIRKGIIEILEGGEAALKLRMKKLRHMV